MNLILFLSSCVEPFEAATENFEKILVIEATITNEFKYQEINLSRTFRLEEEGPAYEINADVKVIDDLQNIYNFQELDSGKYQSTNKFKALLGRNYQLYITTNKGKSYTSTAQQISTNKGLDSVYAVRTFDNSANEGISIFADSFDPSGNSKYYRYEYEETYKVVAPYASGYDAYEISSDPVEYGLSNRTEEKRVCYKTVNSNPFTQTQTTDLFEDRVSRYLIRFINDDNDITSYRYSILVKQYIQSLESYTFYETLNNFSGSESLFTQIQTGHLNGNVFSTNDPDETVIGFFETSSVSSQRIFFKFHDFFPEKPFPRYFTFCHFAAPGLVSPTLGGGVAASPLLDAIASGDWVYYKENHPESEFYDRGGPLIFVEIACGDCTSFASNIKPDYWIN